MISEFFAAMNQFYKYDKEEWGAYNRALRAGCTSQSRTTDEATELSTRVEFFRYGAYEAQE